VSASPVSEDDKVVLNNPKPVPRPGTWISAAIVTVLGAMLIHGLVTNEKFHWSTVWFFLREVHVVKAVGWTLLLTFMAMAIGIVLAVTTAILRHSPTPAPRRVALGSTGNEMGATTIMTIGFRGREEILRIFERITGLRMNHEYIRPGGVVQDIGEGTTDYIRDRLRRCGRAGAPVRLRHRSPAGGRASER